MNENVYERIETNSKTLERVDPDVVAATLGAERVERALAERAKVQVRVLRMTAAREAPPDGYAAELDALKDVPEVTWQELGEMATLMRESADTIESLLASTPSAPQNVSQDEPTQATSTGLVARLRERHGEMCDETDGMESGDAEVLRLVADALEALSSSAPVERPPHVVRALMTLKRIADWPDAAMVPEIGCHHTMRALAREALDVTLVEQHPSRGQLAAAFDEGVFVATGVRGTHGYEQQRFAMVERISPAPAETQEERLPERHPRLNTERARLEQAFNEGSWSSVDNPSPEHDAAMRVVVDWLMGIGPEPVGPGHQLPDEAQPSPETPAPTKDGQS